jgi:hypothetical protein
MKAAARFQPWALVRSATDDARRASDLSDNKQPWPMGRFDPTELT